MSPNPTNLLRLSLHGLAVEISSRLNPLEAEMYRLLGQFRVADFPDGFNPIQGVIQPYDELDVLRHVSPDAVRYTPINDPLEVYFEQERFWLVDERWGMVEMNLLKGHWRSWLLNRQWHDRWRAGPGAAGGGELGRSAGPGRPARPFGAVGLDPLSVAEMSILWPMAQLLRSRRLHLVPATALVRDGWGVLLFAPGDIGGEVPGLVSAGFHVLARRWVALREEDGRVAMLHLPDSSPVHDHADSAKRTQTPPHHAFCDTVALVSPVRRSAAGLDQLELEQATPALRRAWPIAELHPHRRRSRLHAELARTCRCWQMRLSLRGGDLPRLLDEAQSSHPIPLREPSPRGRRSPSRRAG